MSRMVHREGGCVHGLRRLPRSRIWSSCLGMVSSSRYRCRCFGRRGQPPTSAEWADFLKGSEESRDIRCRLLARDYKPEGEKARPVSFAAMPPREAKTMMFRRAAMAGRAWMDGGSAVAGRRT